MEETMKINNYRRCIISKDDIILEVGKDFLHLTGYRERDLLGKSLGQAGKILRTDAQVNLQDIEDARIFVFTKDLQAIEGKLSCKNIDKGAKKVFSFKIDPCNPANESFNLAHQLVTSRENGVAIFSFSSLILINSNQNYLNLLEPPYNNKSASIGKSIIDLSPEYLKSQLYNMKNYLKNIGRSCHMNETYIYSRILGESYWNISLVPILENKKIRYLIVSLSNETEKVTSRQAVKDKNKEIEETLEMQNQMFSTISHELKTPLSVIFSGSQLIKMYLKGDIDQIRKEEIGRNIDIIKQNCYRFTKLINNIIDLSKIETGLVKLNYRNSNIIEVVETVVDAVRPYVEEKALSIIFDTEIEEKIMAVDRDKIDRIILNLITNAVKFSNKDGHIYIDIKDQGDFIDILVSDRGIGIDKKDLNSIFNKYKRLDKALIRQAEGSGIGLALVKGIVDLIGGKISVESELGKGSTFTVSLPVKLLDRSEDMQAIEGSYNIMEQIRIEFSDIYDK